MNGQLSEQPLAELIREISAKSLGGRLSLEHDRIKVVSYFDDGTLVYAASNLRTLRLREYLKKTELVSETDLARFNERLPDIELLKQLTAQKLLSSTAADQLHTRLVTDVLRMALVWTSGTWELESRSRLNEQLNLKIDIDSLLLEASRRMPKDFIALRFRNEAEVITPRAEPLINDNLLPAEAFLLSRLDRPMALHELVAISGMGETETLRLVYSLGLAGLLQRERWESVLLDQPEQKPAPPPPPPEPEPEEEPLDVETFLERVRTAQTYYDVLGVSGEVSAQSLKDLYYQLARLYHPDRFRKSEPALLKKIESAFARITQAYETLRDDRTRATYDSKLQSRRKAEQLAQSAPKATTPAPQSEPVAAGATEPSISAAERAEAQFKEGFAALELGQRKVALGLFASAASAAPKEPRYRAFYGQMLAANEATRRAAETELLAAVKLDPQNAEYRVMLAELYRDLGLKLRAKGEAERAVAADPDNRKARDLLRSLE
ncbi:MAG TPA: DnaJ domain-containing protein [Pyrinomonadaceae bacterium]|nr:DnaJ domain-containing protein [Pyrinomonadaceae bacterium]